MSGQDSSAPLPDMGAWGGRIVGGTMTCGFAWVDDPVPRCRSRGPGRPVLRPCRGAAQRADRPFAPWRTTLASRQSIPVTTSFSAELGTQAAHGASKEP